MHYENILVPYDSSVHAQRAMAAAQEFALSNPAATIHLLCAVYVDPPVDYEPFAQFEEEKIDQAIARMEADAAEIFTGIDLDRVTVAAVDNPVPSEVIKDYVEKNGCDLIVMGRRGLGGIRALMGSVTAAVLKKVDVPVMAVK